MTQQKPVPVCPETLSRRVFLRSGGLGLGAAMLGWLLAEDQAQGAPGNPLAARPPHFAPKARSIIYFHMVGAPSHLDLFQYKPELKKWDGKPCPEEFIRGKKFAFLRGHPHLAASPFRFRRCGQSGTMLSELLPHLGQVADELCFVHSLHTEQINHGPAQLFLHSGFARPGRPGIGSWLVYGLGSENRNLPAYVVLRSGNLAGAGASLWSSGFLPPIYQGVAFRKGPEPVFFLANPPGHTREDRRRVLDALGRLNRQRYEQLADPEITTRVAQYELAFRMQASLPELTDLSNEDPKTLELYGAKPGRASFAANCLLARRLVEQGVRVVEVYDATWDHHSKINQLLPKKCRQVDRPLAALILDLKRRGLLDQTLVIWAAEFGRTPMQQGNSQKGGRDHHKDAFTVWMAGGGAKRGFSYGQTDPFGYHVTENPVKVHDFNATVLHLMGIDHRRLVFRFQGRDFRLTDVEGRVVPELVG